MPRNTVVVFLHGRGQGPDAVSEIGDAFGSAVLLAPQGGVELRHGFTWFQNERVGVADAGSLRSATTRFLDWLDGQDVGNVPVWLCGFSNGGAFALSLMLSVPERFRGVAALCAPLVGGPWPDGRLRGRPVFYADGGRSDAVVTADLSDLAATYLRECSGAVLTARSYDIPHAIEPVVVADLRRWFACASDGLFR